MAIRRIKTRPPAAKTRGKARRTSNSKKTQRTEAKGSAASGFSTAKKENRNAKKRREAGFVPFRFYVTEGSEARLIVLDKEPFFMYEHNWKGPKGYWDQHCRCIKEIGNCPACQHHNKEGYYVMMLTVLDTRPYKNRDGKTVKYSRKLLPIKQGMIPKYERLYKQKGTFRGMVITVCRDGDKEPRTGGSVDLNKWVSEENLKKYRMKNQDGKTILLSEPVDYAKVFAMPTEAELREVCNMGGSQAGDEEFDDGDVDGVDWDDEDDDDPSDDLDDEIPF